MTRSLTHFVAALTAWSAFYCGLAAFGIGPGAARMSSTTAEQADRAPVRMSDREIAPREVLLTTSDDWFLLGKAIRDVFEHDRRRYGDRLAFDRIRELLARNPHVTSASVDQPYVHLMMAGRPEYVVYLNTTDVTRGEYLARTR